MKKIVIAGAGFGGLTAALELRKQFSRDKNVAITLIDRHGYQLFHPNLYEIAAAEEEFTTLAQLKKSIALPLKALLKRRDITFIQGEIEAVNEQQRKVKAGIRDVEYDYLILALGSQASASGIAGAPEYGLPLKNLRDAFRVRNAVEFTLQAHSYDAVKKYIRIAIVGGGHAGVELAGELSLLCDVLSWKNNYPREKIEILVLEASNGLVPGLGGRCSKDVFRRLVDLGVAVRLLNPVFKVSQNFLELASGERIAYDVLIRTTGIQPALPKFLALSPSGQENNFIVDEYLRLKGRSNIFAAGDLVGLGRLGGGTLPATAQTAIAHGRYLASSLPLWMRQKNPPAFRFKPGGYIVSVGGKWGVYQSDKVYLTGLLPYILRLAANVRYFAGLIGFWKALRYVMFEADIYGRND